MKRVFETKSDGDQIYCLETDEGKILRGADTYYYFLTNKGKSKDVTEGMVYTWTKNYVNFFKTVLGNFPRGHALNSYDRRLVLGVLDNIRNISLIMLNASIVLNANEKNALLGLQNSNLDSGINKWSEICKVNSRYIRDLCFAETIDENYIEEMQQHLFDTINSFVEDVEHILDNCTKDQLNKSFRTYREIDNYIENYIALSYALQKIKESNPQILGRPLNFIGATYGGLELPFIADEILNENALMSTIILQSKYKDRRSEDYLSESLTLQNLAQYQSSYNIICDDNVLTGKTLQSMINILFSNDIPVNNIAIVRYPSINRVNQMIAENSAVDVTKFFSYIQGLVFSSPYTKINANDDGKYLDALGIFNKDRRRLLEYLFKNGRYSEDSEVAMIGQMYKGGNK